jgi:tetratricopeptide (TPR) repeat protein
MPRLCLRLVLVLAVALSAPAPAEAQLGIDLSAPQQKKKSTSKKSQKKKQTQKKEAQKKEAPAETPPPMEAAPAPQAAPAEAAGAAAVQAAPAPQAAPAQEPLSLQPLDVGKKGAAKPRLDAAKKLFDDKAYETAALAYDQILRDPSLADGHAEARYQLAKCLVRLGLYYSALEQLDQILDRGPQGSKYYHSALEWVFYVGKKLGNEQPLLSRVAKYSSAGFPPAYQDRFNYLLAKYEFERGRALQDAGRVSDARSSYAEARRLAALVRKQSGGAPVPTSSGDSPGAGEDGNTYAKARFVDGLVLYATGDEQGAAESFKDVVRLTNPKKYPKADQAVRELAFLQLARIHYENRQNRYAIWYYGKMPWGGDNWLEGLWEGSYAYYRIGDYEKTLGNLLTLQSPYFRDEYFPESYVLKAIVYYENCRYPEARAILEDFSSIYEPVYEELASITTKAQPPSAYYGLIAESERAEASESARGRLMRKIMKLAFTDENIERLSQSIRGIEDELDVRIGESRPEFRQSALGKQLVDRLGAEKTALSDEAGRRARAKLEYERDELRTLLAQALRIKIEVSRKEREVLEGSIAAGGQVEVLRDLKFSAAVSDEHLYWPYEGEFWRDELGTYSYTLTKGCKDRTQRSAAAQ